MPKQTSHVKSNSLAVDKFEKPKLTKQQKRDLKRNSLARAVAASTSTTTSTSTDTTLSQTAKLTKQQKRDLKRNAQAKQQTQQDMCLDASDWSRELSTDVPSQFSEPLPGAKASVYKRKANYPPLYLSDQQLNELNIPRNRFVTQDDKCYDSVIASAYQGFHHSPTESFSRYFHTRFERAMIGLETKEEAYQYDVTQPGGLGTKTAMTYVTRCVVGDPGTTYKYLGLRMFSIPWTKGCVGASDNSVEIGRLNEIMIKKSEELLAEKGQECGSCQYNLTLINRCFPPQQSLLDLKDEPTFKNEKCTVSWHADSTLEHFSTIGVYHVTCSEHPGTTLRKTEISGGGHRDDNDKSWRIAMRVHYDAEGPNLGKPTSRAAEMKDAPGNRVAVPPVLFALPSKSAYFLLDEFNHHHQHSVMAGDTHRYASTHRVCRTDGHTFQSIKALCVNVLQQRVVYTAKYFRALLNTANIVEFEWLRQYYVQGRKHQETHMWWEEAMKELLEMWNDMRKKTILGLEVLRDAAAGRCLELEHASNEDNADMSANRLKKQKAKQFMRIESVDRGSFSIASELLKERVQKRKDWHTRQTDPIFQKLSPEYRPIDPPLPPYNSAAAELILLPCREDGSVDVTFSGCSDELASFDMSPVNITQIVSDDMISIWERRLFG